MKKRIEWSEYEQDNLVRAMLDLHKKEPKMGLIKLVQTAQITLPENRRRNIVTVQNLPQYLRNTLINASLLSPNWEEENRRKNKAADDPNVIRLNQIADERDAAIAERDAARVERDEARKEIRQLQLRIEMLEKELKNQPTEGDVVKNFIADILFLNEAKRRAVPGASHLPRETPPPTETLHSKGIPPGEASEGPDRRQVSRVETVTRKTKLVLVGGQPNTHSEVEKALKEFADIKYFGASKSGVGEHLKAYKDPLHGKVILWTRVATHSQESSLKYHNIPYTKLDAPGTTTLISSLRQIATQASR